MKAKKRASQYRGASGQQVRGDDFEDVLAVHQTETVRRNAIGKVTGRHGSSIRWTLLRASEEFGVTRETIRRGLRALGVDSADGTFTTRQVHTAIAGDLDAERIRDTRASANLKEMDEAERRGELVAMSDVERLYTDCLLPIRQRFLALPAECAVLANPTDPTHAREQLQAWVDKSLPMIREKLPKPSKK